MSLASNLIFLAGRVPGLKFKQQGLYLNGFQLIVKKNKSLPVLNLLLGFYLSRENPDRS